MVAIRSLARRRAGQRGMAVSPKTERTDVMPTIKITENVRADRLRRVDGEFIPSVTRDSVIPGFALHVTSQRAFWALQYRPQGVNPATGKRWGGGARLELGDAFSMSLADARAAALAAKASVRQGRDPLREALASRAAAVAERAVLPTTIAQSLDAYDRALMARRSPSEATRKQTVSYARKAIRLMRAEDLALTALTPAMARLLAETAPGSDGERRHVFGGLSRFLTWCRRQGLIETNVCDALHRDERPKPGKARDNAPPVDELRAIWAAVEDEPTRDLVRFLLLVPLRRDEAAGLRWAEVDIDRKRICIAGDRMKNGAAHELPLSEPARAILSSRKPSRVRPGDLVFPSGADKAYDGWNRLTTRVRKALGQQETPKAASFTFHDVRRSFVSSLAGRFDVDLLDQCLSHTRAGVFGVYQRSARWPERVAALGAWGALVTGAEAQAGNVVRFAAQC
jgi:integrase